MSSGLRQKRRRTEAAAAAPSRTTAGAPDPSLTRPDDASSTKKRLSGTLDRAQGEQEECDCQVLSERQLFKNFSTACRFGILGLALLAVLVASVSSFRLAALLLSLSPCCHFFCCTAALTQPLLHYCSPSPLAALLLCHSACCTAAFPLHCCFPLALLLSHCLSLEALRYLSCWPLRSL